MEEEELVSACQEYFDLNQNKLYCFGDLLRYLAKLDKASVSKFIEYASKSQDEKEVCGKDLRTCWMLTFVVEKERPSQGRFDDQRAKA